MTATDAAVERVARAIAASVGTDEIDWRAYECEARAAIAALSPVPASASDAELIEHLRLKTGYDLEKVAKRAADRLEALTKSPPQETVEAIIERCARATDHSKIYGEARERVINDITSSDLYEHLIVVAGEHAIRRFLKLEQLTSTLNEVGND